MKALFEIFSRRTKAEEKSPEPITQEFRYRVLMLCRDTFSDWSGDFWSQIHHKLQYLHGTPVLARDARPEPRGPDQDALAFLERCESDHFLDFVEYIFRVEIFWRFTQKAPELVETINSFFSVDGLPYHLTDFVEVEEREVIFGREQTVTKVGAYPKVVLKEHDLLHQEATHPALQLLSSPGYESANQEFLEALEDYRKGDLGDCLTKCGSAFESVMKIICAKRGWPYQETDTAGRLLKTIIERTSLESFLEQPLMLVATIRNRLSKSHGAGVQTKDVSAQIARFALNATAASILLLVEETK